MREWTRVDERIDCPDIAMLLERISKEEREHRDEIRDMLMRSDAFAGSFA